MNIGLPRKVQWNNKFVNTGIFKESVSGEISVNTLNINGDGQADLSVHGGPDKAIYAYPIEHYKYWQKQLPDMELPLGIFGENFTISGLLEKSVNIGDSFRIGTIEVMVTQPRMPCSKLGIRFQRADMPKRFLKSLRSGFYLRVLKGGVVKAGDTMTLVHRDENNFTVTDAVKLYAGERNDMKMLQSALKIQD